MIFKIIFFKKMIRQSLLRIFKFNYSNTTKRVLLTGIQPTGNLHIGNYLGSITNMLQLQSSEEYSSRFLMIADYHSLTTALHYDHDNIKFNNKIGEDSLKMAKLLISSGIQQEKMCLFIQSQVPQHAQLTWIFSCLGPEHWLNTMIQYKQKSHENNSVGLYTYPILMAADILLYQASHVPVGVDQKQHIQLTNKFAERFNKQFKVKFFPKVKYVQSKFPKIMSLIDPKKKMSKSDSNERSRINLSDSQSQIRQKIRRAVTDSNGNQITYELEQRVGLANLLQLYSAFTQRQISDIVKEYQTKNQGISHLKQNLSNIISSKLLQIQSRMKELSDQQTKKILKEGVLKARQIAENNIKHIKQILNIYH